ncbi:MAG: DUF4190 domain-containing protein [Saccharofermentans sp.]|nr:DUF4190 domain-containing protein [Saccharofermentans sp.]
MIKCPSCGFENNDGTKFCNECGASLNSTQENTTVAETITPPPQQTNNNKKPQNYKKTDNMSIVGLCLGILSMLFILISTARILGFLGAIIGLVFSIAGLAKIKKTGMAGKGLATAGLVLSSVAIIIGGILFTIGFVKGISSAIKDSEPTTIKTEISTSDSSDTKATENTKESTTESTTETTAEETYEQNSYYEIVEQGTFYNILNYTHIVHKVLAKQDATVSATMIAYSEDGSILGKSTSDITLTSGEYNYFEYSFENDVSAATLKVTVSFERGSWLDGARSAVVMDQYNQSGDYLYITLRQVDDNIGAFAKYKILYYKNDQIVDTDEGFFSIFAENLNGSGSTDVAEIWVYGKDFDRIEYMFEP